MASAFSLLLHVHELCGSIVKSIPIVLLPYFRAKQSSEPHDCQEERNGTNFSLLEPSSEELHIYRIAGKFGGSGEK